MSDIVIRAENLSKRYRIGERERYLALRDALARTFSAPARLFRAHKPASSNGDATHIWAVKDVSFEVHQGEVVGIIGSNGGGKTTLLKILAQVTRPTEGHAQVRGRVGSLLEVGTGFHPELTGRENTFLSGAILGMSKAEILRKFDEIVAFAEVEKFIDTPLKHYSSGMAMRLAFAVAAHLEPEILLVDEVLAVGDVQFQKKCLGKMSEVAKAGRTVLFVSHSMTAVTQLCGRCMHLEGGVVANDGLPDDVVAAYMLRNEDPARLADEATWERTGTGRMRVTALTPLDDSGAPCRSFMMGRHMQFRIEGLARDEDSDFTLALQLVTRLGVPALWAYDQSRAIRTRDQKFLLQARLESVAVMPGTYDVRVWIGRAGFEEYDYVQSAARIDVLQTVAASVTLPVTNSLGFVYARPAITDLLDRGGTSSETASRSGTLGDPTAG